MPRILPIISPLPMMNAKPQECMSYHFVARSESFEHTYHGCALKNDDEQAGNHCHAGHCCHDGKYYPDIQVEQFEPGEYLSVEFLYVL